MDGLEDVESQSHKRIRLSSPEGPSAEQKKPEPQIKAQAYRNSDHFIAQAEKELNVGITEYVNASGAGFSGTFKRR